VPTASLWSILALCKAGISAKGEVEGTTEGSRAQSFNIEDGGKRVLSLETRGVGHLSVFYAVEKNERRARRLDWYEHCRDMVVRPYQIHSLTLEERHAKLDERKLVGQQAHAEFDLPSTVQP